MSKDLPDEILIELAKKAKPVPVEIDTPKRAGAPEGNYSSVSDFMNATGLKPGRNKVKTTIIYEAYCQWAKNPMAKNKFFNNLTKFIKKDGQLYYKVNMMPITLMEIIKDINKNEENKETKDEIPRT